jgi:hypothetical protein
VDIDLSSGDETTHWPVHDASVNPKVPAVDDARNVGAISAESITLGSIMVRSRSPSLVLLIRSPMYHPLVGVAKNVYTLLLV